MNKKHFIILFLLLQIGQVYAQIKSIKIIEKAFASEDSKQKSSCIYQWEKYDKNGNIVFKQDFPSDKCWEKNGPWEHHYRYNDKGFITEEKKYGHSDKGMILMLHRFYTPLSNIDSLIYIEKNIKYNYSAKSKSERKKIQLISFDTICNRELVYKKTLPKQDTVGSLRGFFLTNTISKIRLHNLNPTMFETLIDKKTNQKFEREIRNHIADIFDTIKNLSNNIEQSYTLEFIESKCQRKIKIEYGRIWTKIAFSYLNSHSDAYITYGYVWENVKIDQIRKYKTVSKMKYYF